ncbi:MAG: aspartate/glutamate racemase family protein [Clostridiales bacterium]|nr:aspartate/glutamate racemase family protein [Clostridiales bacterium]
MKTIGLIGGMSWESTVTYYQIINETIKKELGGLHSAKILLYSVDFAEIEKCQADGDWNKSGEILGNAAKNLEKAGADYIVICTNTMHKVVPQIQKKISIPIIHIAEATAEKLKENKIRKVALLGTKYTMTQDFYKEKLIEAGIEVLIPCKNDIEIVNDVIYNELCLGVISEDSKKEYLRIIDELSMKGAEGVILGCTEIGLLIKQNDTILPVFDTTQIHAYEAAIHAISKKLPSM